MINISKKMTKIIQVGYWMRKCNAIYEIETSLIKYWLPGGHDWKDSFCKMYPNSYLKYLNDNSVIIKTQSSNEDYDDLLSENIVLLNVFHSSGFYPKFRVENSKNNIFHKPTTYTPSILHG